LPHLLQVSPRPREPAAASVATASPGPPGEGTEGLRGRHPAGHGVEGYAYIDAVTPGGDMWQLCRLKWNGHHGHWEFAIYLASRDGYQPNIVPSGWPTGTPEEAIDCAGLLYLND